jgi:hypothetical protein
VHDGHDGDESASAALEAPSEEVTVDG